MRVYKLYLLTYLSLTGFTFVKLELRVQGTHFYGDAGEFDNDIIFILYSFCDMGKTGQMYFIVILQCCLDCFSHTAMRSFKFLTLEAFERP